MIIPAIDIMDGKSVRLKCGDFSKRTTYMQDPVKMAQLFKRMGYKYIHVIDLDGAKEGSPKNIQTVSRIIAETGLKIQFGGGLRNIKDIEKMLDLGVDRVILGTVAINNPKILPQLIKKYGIERIVVAMDIQNGEIAIKGWQEKADKTPENFLKEISKIGIKIVLLTDITKDGLKDGVDADVYRKFVNEFPNIKFLAAGGIRTWQDVKRLEEVGVSATIMGSIFYEGSLLTKRIIPCLDVKDGRTVKGVNFLNLRDAGDPVELAKLYSKQGADELCFLDITASTDRRKTIVDLVQKVAKEIDIPFTVGGGINTIEDISAVLMAGADKVSISSGIVKNPDLINKATKAFGSQCIVASLDVKKVGTSWKITIKGGREITSLDAIEWAKEVEERGAGEILLNSMDRDGTKLGFDIELLRAVKNVVKIPVIASGGAGTIEDFVELLKADVADAALAASVFHFGEIRIPELKKVLLSNYLMIRP